MIRALTIILTFYISTSFGQKMPDLALYKVRLTEADRTVVFEVRPTKVKDIDTDKSYYWYSSRAIHITQGNYSGKLLNGDYSEFYISRTIKEKGKFQDGLKNGLWQIWNENGFLQQSITWKKGMKDGVFILFDSKGNKTQEGTYVRGFIDGKLKIYHSTDSTQILAYEHGNLIRPGDKTASFWQRLIHLSFRKRK